MAKEKKLWLFGSKAGERLPGCARGAADDGIMACLPEKGKTAMFLASALEVDRHTPADDKGVF